MSEQQRQPTAESHQSVNIGITHTRSMTRKNPQTGRSNYPTIRSGKMTIIRYVNGVKSMTNKVYRRIQPSD